MPRWQFTPHAVDDLFEIWSYIARESPAAADRVEEAIYLACDFLAGSPLIGSPRKDLTTLPVRFWLVPPYPNYFIIYNPETKPLQIIRILHGARDIPSILP